MGNLTSKVQKSLIFFLLEEMFCMNFTQLLSTAFMAIFLKPPLMGLSRKTESYPLITTRAIEKRVFREMSPLRTDLRGSKKNINGFKFHKCTKGNFRWQFKPIPHIIFFSQSIVLKPFGLTHPSYGENERPDPMGNLTSKVPKILIFSQEGLSDSSNWIYISDIDYFYYYSFVYTLDVINLVPFHSFIFLRWFCRLVEVYNKKLSSAYSHF